EWVGGCAPGFGRAGRLARLPTPWQSRHDTLSHERLRASGSSEAEITTRPRMSCAPPGKPRARPPVPFSCRIPARVLIYSCREHLRIPARSERGYTARPTADAAPSRTRSEEL